ncbi:hypothetical protein DID80_05660 [Candidatus Marinamargulisbacteria bacterium SCGC AAA071-K20]|nr:hypothetical protein DID80_05660 [Candidatus Marinamargulisbacteria bacterium SCGC AAA071-K20]
MRIKLYTYLKNTDLHAISALEAIQHYMGYTDVVTLKRHLTWTFDLDCNDKKLSQQIERIVSDTYYIVNPNKQSYYVNFLPKPTISNDQSCVALEVEKDFKEGESEISEKIFEKTGIKLNKLKQSLVWEVVVNSKNRDYDTIKNDLNNSITNTSSRGQGLLVNSFYETHQFLDEKALYQTL